MRAERQLSDIASGRFDRPAAAVGITVVANTDTRLLGLAFTQFALPVVAGRALDSLEEGAR